MLFTSSIKSLFILCLLSLCSLPVFAQDITGAWGGTLKIQHIALDLVFNIRKSDTGYTASMDSPDQGAKGIPVKEVRFQNGLLRLSIPEIGLVYDAKMSAKGDTLSGTFIQRGQSLPLDLVRAKTSTKARPQTPLAPYPYYTEEVYFENKTAGIRLAGTLSLPSKKGTYPVVVLVSGSGAQDRDETILGHKPFLVLADYLTRNGFAVLRYDDRGTAGSTGNFVTAITRDFANDALAAVTYLRSRKEINKKQVGLIGHSEGAIIAPMLAAQSKDIAYIVMLAGPAVPGSTLLLQQQKAIAAAEGLPEAQAEEGNRINSKLYDIVVQSKTAEEADVQLSNYLKQALHLQAGSDTATTVAQDATVRQYVSELSSPWIRFFLKHDPAKDLQKVTCPVLALYGEKDVQVPAKDNAAAARTALQAANNTMASIVEIPELNHLFQECSSGAPSEYATIEQTFSPKALTEILNWLKFQVKQK